MTGVYRNSPLTILIFISFVWFSCSGGSATKEQTDEVQQTPPSVSGEKGELLLVTLSDKELEELKIETARVNSDIQNYSLRVPGVVFPAQNHVSIISTPIDGQVRGIMVRDGQLVRQGQELFRIESLVFGNLVAEYLQAIAEEKFQTSRLERTRQLVEETISSGSELDRATSDYQRATASSNAAYARLKAIGVPDHEIDLFKNGGKIDPSLKIHAPIGGSFDQRQVELGQSVNALQELGRLIDLKRVLVKGYLNPEDAGFISPGDSVKLFRREDGTGALTAIIASVNPGLDEDNRSVVVNVEVAARNNWPKPGENIRMEIYTSSAGKVFAVPLKALTYDGNNPVVFIKKDAHTYEKRYIEIGEIRDQHVIVRNGIRENEELAVSQVFSLKALSRYEQIAEE
ncbi:MAG: efflux RND transporter periplasmic adaptor subunit [Prolixibacteraceae bacterium]